MSVECILLARQDPCSSVAITVPEPPGQQRLVVEIFSFVNAWDQVASNQSTVDYVV